MKIKTALIMGVDCFTLLDLLQKAALYKNLNLQENVERAYSEPIKTYTLDDKLLRLLAKQRIKQQVRTDKIFTLIDENPQEKVRGYNPSNYWNFELLDEDNHKFDLQISLLVGFETNIEKRGIVLWPKAHGSFLSPVDPLPNFRMFKALVENDKDAPAVAKELAASDGNIVVTWTDIGLGGVRRITDLFAEFAGQNEVVKQLERKQEVFNPVPNPKYQQPGDELFIIEPAQPKIIQIWRAQLEEYRANLVA